MPNISYFNQVITSTTSTGIAEIKKTYDSPIFKRKDGKQYKLCVDKFKSMLTGIPMFIFDASVNAYTIELTTGALTSGRISLLPYFVSAWTGVMTATNPMFYYVYIYDQFVATLNRALADAFAIISVLPAFPAGNTAPFFRVDPATHIISLYVSPDYLETSANLINIFTNAKLMYSFMTGMSFFGLNPNLLSPLVNGRDARFNCLNQFLNTVTIGGIEHHIQTTNSMADTLINWNICKGIVITTNLRTRNEGFPEGEQTAVGAFVNNSNLNSIEILMNFDILYGNNSRPLLLNYVASTYDKMIDIVTNEDNNDIGLKFYWYDKNNKLYPLTIYGDDTCSIRLAFIEL